VLTIATEGKDQSQINLLVSMKISSKFDQLGKNVHTWLKAIPSLVHNKKKHSLTILNKEILKISILYNWLCFCNTNTSALSEVFSYGSIEYLNGDMARGSIVK